MTAFATQSLTTADGRTLAFLSGGEGPAVLMLHGHCGRARGFLALARAITSWSRWVALDQRGHGRSSAAPDYGRDGYVEDLAEVIEQLGLAPVTVVGHSLGGINAMHLAARRPDLVRALVVVDIGAEVDYPLPFLDRLQVPCDTLADLRKMIRRAGLADDGFLLESVVERADGWAFCFDPADVRRSQRALDGNHWDAWTASAQPALIVCGEKSDALSATLVEAMVGRRPNTSSVTIPGAGHVPHHSHSRRFVAAVEPFLANVAKVATLDGRPTIR